MECLPSVWVAFFRKMLSRSSLRVLSATPPRQIITIGRALQISYFYLDFKRIAFSDSSCSQSSPSVWNHSLCLFQRKSSNMASWNPFPFSSLKCQGHPQPPCSFFCQYIMPLPPFFSSIIKKPAHLLHTVTIRGEASQQILNSCRTPDFSCLTSFSFIALSLQIHELACAFQELTWLLPKRHSSLPLVFLQPRFCWVSRQQEIFMQHFCHLNASCSLHVDDHSFHSFFYSLPVFMTSAVLDAHDVIPSQGS